jgi:UDP-N-acetylglucosamine 2-epimerase (non-hydrolysing)
MKKIAIVIGTKAELIKCMPVMLELQRRRISYWFIHTGQHPLKEACKEFRVKEPDFILSEEPKKSTKFWSKVNKSSLIWFVLMIFKIRQKIKEIKPSYILYHGDTMSTAAASIGSSKLFNFDKEWKNVHLEAGLRSGALFEPFPEEISRKISDYFSDILLAVSNKTQKFLEKEYSGKNIIKIGNTVIDSSLIIYEKSKKNKKPINEEYALINVHRHENLQNKKRLSDIVEIIKSIKIKAIWPLHDNTKHYLEKYNLLKEIEENKNIEITPLVDYKKFIFLMANCKYLITDGGSIQEESLVFKKPCIILRKATERQEGLDTGINFLTKLDVNYSKELIETLEKSNLKIKSFKNPYGEKGLSKKIVDILVK